MGCAPRLLEKQAIATPIAAALGGTTVCPLSLLGNFSAGDDRRNRTVRCVSCDR